MPYKHRVFVAQLRGDPVPVEEYKDEETLAGTEAEDAEWAALRDEVFALTKQLCSPME